MPLLEDLVAGALTSGVNVSLSRLHSRQAPPSRHPPSPTWASLHHFVPAMPPLQKPTLLVLNLSLVGCVLILVSLLFVTASSAPDLLPHLAVLLVFALGLIASVNW